jgi:hypothetical protein
MKWKSQTALTLILVSLLAAYAFAQSQPENGQTAPKAPSVYRGTGRPYVVVGRGVGPNPEGIPPSGIILIQSVNREDGKADYVIPPSPLFSTPTIRKGTLRIEMQDGSSQVVDLTKVKKVTIEK